MRLDLFSIPIFIDTIDLSKIDIGNPPTDRIWLSETPSTMGQEHKIKEETYSHLTEVFVKNLGPELIGPNPRFGEVWRNVYDENDWQDIHIHPHASWSFIIYETVEESRTVFMNPLYRDIQNHLGTNVKGFPLDFRPELKAGNIIIFPSFIQHFVRPGNVGSTISGNVYMDYF
jgi:hypothetical protein